MPQYIDIKNKKVVLSIPSSDNSIVRNLTKLFINVDCETQEQNDPKKLTVKGIGLFLPQVNDRYAIVYYEDDLNEDFNPITKPLKDLGINVDFATEEEIEDLTGSIFDIFEEIKANKTAKEFRKAYNFALKKGAFDEILEQYNLTRENLELVKDKQTKELELNINLPQLDIHEQTFFGQYDFFKVIGKKHQDIFLEAELEARRVLTTHKGKIAINPMWIGDRLYEVNLILRDAMNRIPPKKRSLDNQCKIFDVEIPKINIKKPEIAKMMGLDSVDEIMHNIELLIKYDFNLFCLYTGFDPVATQKLSDKQIEYINHIRKTFELEKYDDIRDTTGSNVSNFIKDLQIKHFIDCAKNIKITLNSEDKIDECQIGKIVKKKLKQSHINNLQSLEYNNYGIQPFRTVGGLLYSRVQRYPIIRGILGDLDLKSCYLTAICNLNIYSGQPIVTTFKNKNYKPTVIDTINFLSNNCPRDAWYIRVTGNLANAINTLILSDLDFTTKRLKVKTIWDIDPSRKSIGLFNAFKTSNPLAKSTLLTKEIKFGLINADLWDAIKLLPPDWIEEYKNLLVDCLVFIPRSLICHSVKELEKKSESLPDHDAVEKFNPKSGLKEITLQYSKDNLCLSFPAKDYFIKLREIRSKLKKAKNPVQEVYKLFGNSTYGALACIYLPVNNLLAANIITAVARTSSWLMTNRLNGFQNITDGATFAWNHIPLKTNFREILTKNPNYLIDFNPSITNDFFNYSNVNQEWIDKNFKRELAKFYNVDESYPIITKFDFELKDETFIDKSGKEITSVIYTDFYNTGSGNYSKGMNGSHILIDATEYDFYDFNSVKARSFKGGNEELAKWYIDALDNGYSEPYRYCEKEIIKFGLGNRLAIQFLESDPNLDEIAHPMGFTRKCYKLMKLITRSQFLFKTEKQLVNFEKTNYYRKLDCASKDIFTRDFWKKLKLEDLKLFGVTELKPNIDYFEFSKKHPIGIGFEVLTLNNVNKGDITSVRNFIADKIEEGKTNFNAALHIDRNVKLAKKFKLQFAAIVVLKANAEEDLKQLLVNSKDEPTILSVNRDRISRLEEILCYAEPDNY